jgi:pimeloyl-ACP methyl ester carboxylesterase
MYRALRAPRREFLRVRGLDMHLTHWGPEPTSDAPLVLLLHGWQDTGETFQFMVDAFERDLPLTALDWRGFGRSEWPQEGYWFPDYLADLDALLLQVSAGARAQLVGHSMGGNIASLYAGLRPERVRCVVNLEGVGLPRTSPEQAPSRLRRWLDEVQLAPAVKEYDSFDQLAAIIAHRYPRICANKAAFVARAWGRQDADGRIRLMGDGRHRRVNPILYKREDAEACWREVKAPMLLILGAESSHVGNLGQDGTPAAFRAIMPHVNIENVAGAGHLLHIEKPDAVAPLIEAFLAAN